MRKLLSLICFKFIFLFLSAQNPILPIYQEAKGKFNYLWRLSDRMPDGEGLFIDDAWQGNPKDGETCIRIGFDVAKSSNGWVAANWKSNPGEPVNIIKKLNIKNDQLLVLTFWCRGKAGGERVKFKVGGAPDSTESLKPAVESQWLKLDTTWKQFTINLDKKNLSGLIEGFCFVIDLEHNFGKDQVWFFLDDIVFEKGNLPTKGQNEPASFLESNHHLVQFFGDYSGRKSNFFRVGYNGGSTWNEFRFFFPRLSKMIPTKISLPDPYFTALLKAQRDINWEDRLDMGIGLEWRPFNKFGNLRFYTLYQWTEFLRYDPAWSWRPKSDYRIGTEFYKESHFLDYSPFWSEMWADFSWRKTNFFIPDFNAWTFGFVPKFGLKAPAKNKFRVMPYLTGELSLAGKTVSINTNYFWQNRILVGGGFRWMPFLFHANEFFGANIRRTRFYAEALYVAKYLRGAAEQDIPDFDFRMGVTYVMNRR
ncbi:hypothetical protein [Haliscomenobacter hydrossis]|uniref:CBM-cenC domain-containing protein n=1 Tax=Haliscomenobacter hydrossis (strain ATCC 27775 / DSM 1100 / LMG 10767 / O) TaxID=760192 RepID=F4L872_HALH1|nr:hypothetical protein [Haliscomenobacter hydrossis]AEE54580.1 hypothetical protein Halhy_6767 [Haliscomenobacter hydrossis DSM 1100]